LVRPGEISGASKWVASALVFWFGKGGCGEPVFGVSEVVTDDAAVFAVEPVDVHQAEAG
jgi:hypothetical protein